MSHPAKMLTPEHEVLELPRIFVREPGWKVAFKHGSEREFCYTQAPGEDHYHRLADGEAYVQRGDERICLPCAGRLGLLRSEPRGLREPILSSPVEGSEPGPGYDLGPPRA